MPHQRIDDLLHATAWYRDGPPIGPVTRVFVDDEHRLPRWAAVPAGRLVPLCRAVLTPDRRLVALLPPGAVEAAPRLPTGATAIGVRFEDALYAHYAHALAPVGTLAPAPASPVGDRVAALAVAAPQRDRR